jgi:hypothetical protein
MAVVGHVLFKEDEALHGQLLYVQDRVPEKVPPIADFSDIGLRRLMFKRSVQLFDRETNDNVAYLLGEQAELLGWMRREEFPKWLKQAWDKRGYVATDDFCERCVGRAIKLTELAVMKSSECQEELHGPVEPDMEDLDLKEVRELYHRIDVENEQLKSLIFTRASLRLKRSESNDPDEQSRCTQMLAQLVTEIGLVRQKLSNAHLSLMCRGE